MFVRPERLLDTLAILFAVLGGHAGREEGRLLRRFGVLSRVPYAEQAKHFMNAFWSHKSMDFCNDGEAREEVWRFCALFVSLDKAKGEAGTELDEFQAHQFLERAIKPMTIKELRERLGEIDLDDNHHMSLSDFLIYH